MKLSQEREFFGTRGIFNKSVDTVLTLAGDGTQIIADALARALAKLTRHPTIVESRARRRVLLIFVTVIDLITISFAYYVLNVRGLDLGWGVGIPLYAFLVVTATAGLRKRRKQKPKDEPKPREPLPTTR